MISKPTKGKHHKSQNFSQCSEITEMCGHILPYLNIDSSCGWGYVRRGHGLGSPIG